MKGCVLVLFFILLFVYVAPAKAIVNPLDTQNNKFGIHIIDENDLNDATSLVNSSGGEWGYVTLVIKEDDRDLGKWQKIFDRMRELKIIPLLRLATKPVGDYWEKPNKEDAQEWSIFLNSLNWVVQNRYIILFNEPNHAKEWGGKVNPSEYAEILKNFNLSFKEKSPDYYILPAGLDASAPNSKDTLEISNFLSKMYETDKQIFNYIDGWNSHSYPNPAFVAKSQDKGKGSIASFDWEIKFIKRIGANPDLPIFVTETGWVHNNGKIKVLGLDSELVGSFYKFAFEKVWNDKRIVAVTPFVLNYQDSPFDFFSWKKFGSQEFHPQYKIVQDLQKIAGNPKQVNNLGIVTSNIPNSLFSGLSYKVEVIIKNYGQSIWSPSEGYRVIIPEDLKDFIEIISDIETVKPFESSRLSFLLKPFYGMSNLNFSFQMAFKNEVFDGSFTKNIKIINLFPVFGKQGGNKTCFLILRSCS